jgi:predicted GNAT family N-acyltransferase
MRIKPVENEADWAAARAIRQRVFVEEQACPPEEEWDEHDATARHLLGLVGEAPAACSRWRVVDYAGGPVAKLERFAVLPEFRGAGHGRQMVEAAMADAQRAGHERFAMHAQAHLERFYASLGFRTEGEGFMEAGIPHVKMVR